MTPVGLPQSKFDSSSSSVQSPPIKHASKTESVNSTPDPSANLFSYDETIPNSPPGVTTPKSPEKVEKSPEPQKPAETSGPKPKDNEVPEPETPDEELEELLAEVEKRRKAAEKQTEVEKQSDAEKQSETEVRDENPKPKMPKPEVLLTKARRTRIQSMVKLKIDDQVPVKNRAKSERESRQFSKKPTEPKPAKNVYTNFSARPANIRTSGAFVTGRSKQRKSRSIIEISPKIRRRTFRNKFEEADSLLFTPLRKEAKRRKTIRPQSEPESKESVGKSPNKISQPKNAAKKRKTSHSKAVEVPTVEDIVFSPDEENHISEVSFIIFSLSKFWIATVVLIFVSGESKSQRMPCSAYKTHKKRNRKAYE